MPPAHWLALVYLVVAYSGIKLKAHDCTRGMTPTTVNLSTLTDLAGYSTEPTNVSSSGNTCWLPTENNGNSESAGQNHSAPTAREGGTAVWLSQHCRLQTTLSHPKRRSAVGIPRLQSCGGSQADCSPRVGGDFRCRDQRRRSDTDPASDQLPGAVTPPLATLFGCRLVSSNARLPR